MVTEVAKYRCHVERFDLSDEQKVELIHAVWQILEVFADCAFGFSSLQLAQIATASFEKRNNEALINETRLKEEDEEATSHRSAA